MLARLLLNLRSWEATAGASLVELSMSLLLLSSIGVGVIGATAVGARASAHLEEQDTSLIAARSQAEFIAAKPTLSQYPLYPSLPGVFTVTGDVTDACLQRTYLQCIDITVSRKGKETGSLRTLKADRFLEEGPGDKVVPRSTALERVKTVAVPDLPAATGFAVVISSVLIGPTGILAEWEADEPTRTELRTLTVFSGRPFGAQTTGLTTLPSAVSGTVATGQFRNIRVLSTTAGDASSGDFTVYFFNESNVKTVVSQSARITCACNIEP